jgi:predicted nucleotidyltransferase component of viral defense system
LIDKIDILKIARKKGFPAGTIEKEYMLTIALRQIAKLDKGFIFKGGTALSKVYLDYYRISEDLDFTYIGNDLNDAVETVHNLCKNLTLEIRDENKTSNSYNAEIKFVGPLAHQNFIKIDVSMREKLIFEPKEENVKSFYADVEPFSIRIYDLRELFAEKLRTLIQRSKPRDYFDVWFILKNKSFDQEEIKNAVIEKCRRIGVKYEPGRIFKETENLKKQWKTDLVHLVRELPDYDIIMTELKEKLAFLF